MTWSKFTEFFQLDVANVNEDEVEETVEKLKVVTSGVTLTKNETKEVANVVKIIAEIAEKDKIKVGSAKDNNMCRCIVLQK